MSVTRHHADWLSLIEVSGPFVSLPVLMRTFPQGLEPRDPAQAKALRAAYEEWQDNPTAPGQQRAWVLSVLTEVLGYPAGQLAEGQTLPAGLEANMPEMGETLRPDFALVRAAGCGDRDAERRTSLLDPRIPNPEPRTPILLITSYPAEQSLDRPVTGKHWKATPGTRMMELLHGANVPVGLVTNGEQWMLVYAPRGETTGYASWYAALWLDEPLTLRAFHSLLGVRRLLGVAADSTLAALLKASAEDQQEVTDQLGYQVREAVEVLVQSFDALDRDSGRTLLNGVETTDQYDAALTIMMRLVFLFSAEERGLLHLGKPLYDDNYAVSTLQEQLQEVADRSGEEVLERRTDAWARLLATFRAVHGGLQHQDLLMPAYGGSLFDPDRYPFLEGRAAGTRWHHTAADPLAINNRVVLHLLNSLQRLRTKIGGKGQGGYETRRVSFRALGVEQIGHVYEGLLDHTAVRAAEPVLGIKGTRKKEPEIGLAELESRLARGEDKLIDFLKDETGRSAPALCRELGDGGLLDAHRLRMACDQDESLMARLQPFAGLIRDDSFERPFVVLPGSVYVTAGTNRRSTGTHYTPPSLTEPIVQHTLEPLVYEGPAEGWPRDQWRLKSPKEILALKICDMAMGSGAFLVQACRYLAERLVEAWENAERQHPGQILVSPDGEFSEGSPSERLVPADAAERIAIARRVVADRCLYGVDINPMAVEMAKLSLWLITMDKNRPFTFLDHAFKCGDSLLGITTTKDLDWFYIDHASGQQRLGGCAGLVTELAQLRARLEALPSETPQDIAAKTALLEEAEARAWQLRILADTWSGAGLSYAKSRARTAYLDAAALNDIGRLETDARSMLAKRRPLHWTLEFPEVIEQGGFHAFVGNPPFVGGQKITGALGTDYRDFVVEQLARGKKGSADLCAYFFLQAGRLVRPGGMAGLIATNTIAQGDSREVGLDQLLAGGFSLPRAVPSAPWPGTAALEVAHVWLHKGDWQGDFVLNDAPVDGITALLTSPGRVSGKPYRLKVNENKSFQGSIVLGMGFVLTPDEAAALIERSPKNRDCLFPYLNGEDLNSRADQSPSRWVINFHDWPLNRSGGGSWLSADDKARKDWLRSGVVPADYPGPVAADYPDLLGIVEEKVKPEREKNNRAIRRERWWQYAERAPALYAAIDGMEGIIVKTQVSKQHMFTFILTAQVFDQRVVCTNLTSHSHFALLQSTLHEEWGRHYGSTLETRYTYTPSDCFETFPFPVFLAGVDDIGKHYYQHRQSIMQTRQEGLTKAYNRFHNPAEISPDIAEFRRLHIEMDQAVAAAYGWQNIDLGHDFHDTKQGIRFTISEAARREILDRLLALNHQRHAEEVAAGLHDKKPTKATGRRKRAEPSAPAPMDDLFANLAPTHPNPSASGVDGASPILAFLQTHPGWHGKEAILAATGFPADRWTATIQTHLAAGAVERQGERRGARYRLKEMHESG